MKRLLAAIAIAALATGPALALPYRQRVDTMQQTDAADRGLVVVTANASTPLMAANTARRGFSIQNQGTGECYIRGANGGAVAADFHSLRIAAGAYYETPITHVGTGAINILCVTANTSVYAREW